MCCTIELCSFTDKLVQLICERIKELLTKMCTEKRSYSVSYFVCMYMTVSVVQCIWFVRKSCNHDESAKL